MEILSDDDGVACVHKAVASSGEEGEMLYKWGKKGRRRIIYKEEKRGVTWEEECTVCHSCTGGRVDSVGVESSQKCPYR